MFAEICDPVGSPNIADIKMRHWDIFSPFKLKVATLIQLIY